MCDSTSISCRVLTPQRMRRSLSHQDTEAQRLVGYGANARRALAQITVANALLTLVKPASSTYFSL